jgi:NAD(P)-dependent dehydrogenase (short-subunit alcohol dehydrogenase family)
MMAASFRLDGRCALVTGAGRGLGQAMAIALAEAGADVAGVYVTDIEETRARVQAAGRRFTAIEQDLRGPAAVRRVVEHAVGGMGRLDILINNAGIIRRADSIDFTEADWDDVIDVNLKSVFFLAQAAARQFRTQGGGGKKSISFFLKNIGFLIKTVPFAARKAEGYFHTAIETAKEIGAKSVLGQAYLDLGKLHKAKGRLPEARTCISQAVQSFQECEADVYLKQARDALASLG